MKHETKNEKRGQDEPLADGPRPPFSELTVFKAFHCGTFRARPRASPPDRSAKDIRIGRCGDRSRRVRKKFGLFCYRHYRTERVDDTRISLWARTVSFPSVGPLERRTRWHPCLLPRRGALHNLTPHRAQGARSAMRTPPSGSSTAWEPGERSSHNGTLRKIVVWPPSLGAAGAAKASKSTPRRERPARHAAEMRETDERCVSARPAQHAR